MVEREGVDYEDIERDTEEHDPGGPELQLVLFVLYCGEGDLLDTSLALH